MQHVLVTGVNGFVGQHLAQTFTERGWKVSGVAYNNDSPKSALASTYQTIVCDLSDAHQVKKLDLAPYDAIINLAGLARIGKSFLEPKTFMRINVSILTNLCDRLLEQKLSPRILAISSGAVYESNQSMPLVESSELVQDGSPYALSKIAMEKAAVQYRNRGLSECLIVRPFNHIGPGQKSGFIVPDLYNKLRRAVKTKNVIDVGNLTTRRDYTDVRDVAKAYYLLALANKRSLSSPVYNICRGVSRSGTEILDELRARVPGSEKLKVRIDPAFVRPDDPLELIGDNTLLRQDTGWNPEIPFKQTIRDFATAA